MDVRFKRKPRLKIEGDPYVNIPSGVELRLAGSPGSAGQVLTSQGSGANPTWSVVTRSMLEYPTVDVNFAYLASLNKLTFISFTQYTHLIVTADSFTDKAAEALCAYGQVFYHACGRVVDADNYYYTNTSTAVTTGDFNLGKCVSGTFTTLATEAVDLTSGKWALIMLSISGSTLKAYRESALRLTATDTSLTSGKFGAWFHVNYFTTNPLYMFLRAPSSPSLKPVAYFEVPIVGSGASDDPFRAQMPESIVEDPVLGKRNLLALTHSALIPTDSATGKPIYGTAIVRIFDQPDRDLALYPIDKCIEALKAMRGVRRLTREEAISMAKKMDDNLHDADLTPLSRDKVKEYIDWREKVLDVKREFIDDKLMERYVEEDKGW